LRVSIYLSKKREWLIDLLKTKAEGRRLSGGESSIGRELLWAAEQYYLKEMFEGRLDKPQSNPIMGEGTTNKKDEK
jgi:hypothetical protein